jgi:hypothetical protein
MNRARALTATALLVASCGDSTPVTLKYHPAAGSTFRYVKNQEVKIQAEGDSADGVGQELTIRIGFTQTVKGPADLGTQVAVRVDSVTLMSPQAPPGASDQASQMLRGLESNIVFDDRMKVVTSDVANAAGVPPQMANQIANGLRGASFPLPDRALSVGDSWSVQMEAPTPVPGLSEPLKLTYRVTLQDLTVTGADTVVRLALETSFPKDPINLEVGGARASMTINGTLRGEQEYSLARSAIVSVELKGTVRVSMRGGPMGDASMVMDQGLRLRLLDNPATP